MKTQHIIMAFAALFLGSFFLAIIRKDFVKDGTTLIVGTSPDYPPYEFKDPVTDDIVGFDIDISAEIAKRINKKLIIKDMPFVSLIFGLISGEIDMIASGMSPTPRRAQFVLFSDKYFDNDYFVILTIKDRCQPASLHDLEHKNVVVNSGYTSEAYMDQQNLNLNLIRLQTPAMALIALQSYSADAFICAHSTAKTLLEKISNPDRFTMLALPNTGDACAFALSKQAPQLTQEINAALASMYNDGTLNDLKRKWKLA